ncbi:MAG: GtrA family protein [Caulobacteraceae bacterium]
MSLGIDRVVDGEAEERADEEARGALSALTALFHEGWRYFMASAAALGLDFALLIMLTRFAGAPYLVSAAVGFCAGTALTYAVSVTWVFRQRPVKDRRLELIGFFLIGLAGLALNEVLLKIFVEHFGLTYVLAKVPTAGIGFVTNFAMRRLFLFTHFKAAARPDD